MPCEVKKFKWILRNGLIREILENINTKNKSFKRLEKYRLRIHKKLREALKPLAMWKKTLIANFDAMESNDESNIW